MLRAPFLAATVQLLVVVTSASAQSNWTPTVDTFGSSRAQYLSRDQWECRELAMQSSGTRTGSAARGALRGGAVGAAGGAALGAAFGNAGRGAAVGAAAGGIGRGVQQSNAAEAEFRRTFSNCLRNRGHTVIN
jgi:uncharacterized protein YcfJ